MKPKPVRRYAQPKYPTRLEITARPALLHRYQPPTWRKWPELAGAAGLLLLADTAPLTAVDGPPNGAQNPAQAKTVAVVAPIFQHGEGRGVDGCIVMTPPVFLSEQEALQIIRGELAAKGVELTTNQTTLAGVTISDWKPRVGPTREPVKADLAAPKQKVFVEFLSSRDARQWDSERGKEEGHYQVSSVISYDMPKTAAFVAKRVKQKASEKIYFGTFYDPLAEKLDVQRIATQYQEYQQAKPSQKGKPPWLSADHTAESRRLLRLQVQDFLKWLQAQGVI